MKFAKYSKVLGKAQMPLGSNGWKAQTPYDSSSSQISHKTDDMKFATPWWSARSNPTRKTQIARASPSQVAKFATPGI